MTSAIDFFRCILSFPAHWLAWVAALMAANMMVPLFYIGAPEALFTLGAMMLGAMIQMTLYSRMGFVRLLGVGHIAWLFLVPWLWLRLDGAPADGSGDRESVGIDAEPNPRRRLDDPGKPSRSVVRQPGV